MTELLFAVSLVVGYLLGSLPTGYLVARARGVEIQQVGSGNIGATNVLRSVGLGPALIVVLADPLKGFLAVSIAWWLGIGLWGAALTGLAAVLGNNFNVFLRMRGGKGIATSLGVFAGIAPLATLLAALLGLFTMLVGRYVSLGSLVGMVAAPMFVLMRPFHDAELFLAVALSLLALFRHRENMARLAKGTERRLGERKAP